MVQFRTFGFDLKKVPSVHPWHTQFFENPVIESIKLESFEPTVRINHRISHFILILHTRLEICKMASASKFTLKKWNF